jgi:hemolysin activation/secretion protein
MLARKLYPSMLNVFFVAVCSAMHRILSFAFCVALACSIAPLSAHAQSGEVSQKFDVLEYIVEGNTRLKPIQIEESVYPFLGLGKTIKDVEAAREALEKAYQAAGFVTVGVDIPEQSTSNGIITLKVVEGTIDRMVVRGAKYFSSSMIRERLPELVAGSIPNANTVKSEIAMLNRDPNRRVVPALKPGKTPGTVDVDITVEDTLPISGSFTLSNFRPASSPNNLRLSADLRFQNVGESLFGLGHTLGMSVFTTPQNTSDTRLFSVNYLIPTIDKGSFLFFALRSDTESVQSVGAALVQGKYSQLGFRYFYPIAEAQNSRLNLVLGVDRKANEQLVAQTGIGPLSYTPYTVGLNFQTGTSQDLWKFDTTWVGSVGGSQAKDGQFGKRRLGASSDFGVLKLDLSNDRSLGGQFRLRSRIGAQFSDRPLINLEQVVAGGYDTVRGYFEAEQIGDKSLRGSIEASYAMKLSGGLFKKVEWVSFLDAARLEVVSPAIGQIDRFYLASAGIGSRIRFGNAWQFAGDLAYPLRSTGQTQKGDIRLLARMIYEY